MVKVRDKIELPHDIIVSTLDTNDYLLTRSRAIERSCRVCDKHVLRDPFGT